MSVMSIHFLLHFIGLILGFIALVRMLREIKFNFVDFICLSLGMLLLLF